MSDGKIRILILVLCIGGAVLAGISPSYDHSHARDGRKPLMDRLRVLVFGASTGGGGSAESLSPHPASAAGDAAVAERRRDPAEPGRQEEPPAAEPRDRSASPGRSDGDRQTPQRQPQDRRDPARPAGDRDGRRRGARPRRHGLRRAVRGGQGGRGAADGRGRGGGAAGGA